MLELQIKKLTQTQAGVIVQAILLLIVATLLTALPNAAYAQGIGPPESVQEFGLYLITFLNLRIVPFLFSIALLIFVYYVVRYFIINPDNEDDRKSAKRYAIYSISAFVLMVSIWGIVNLLVSGIGLSRAEPVCPDSVPDGFCRAWGANQNSTGAFLDDGSWAGSINPNNAYVPNQDLGGWGGSINPNNAYQQTYPDTGGSIDPSNAYRQTYPDTGGSINPNNAYVPNQDLGGWGGSIDPNDAFGTAPLTDSQILTNINTQESFFSDNLGDFYVENDSDYYGYNYGIIAQDLNALLAENVDSSSDVEKALAATRLKNLGYVSAANYNGYIDSLNELRTRQGDLPLEPEALNGLTENPPARFVDRQTDTRAMIAAEVLEYYQFNPDPSGNLSAQESTDIVMDNLYNGDPTMRFNDLESYIDQGVITDIDGEAYERFINDLNTELFYQDSIPYIE